jgi:hypothetical protein
MGASLAPKGLGGFYWNSVFKSVFIGVVRVEYERSSTKNVGPLNGPSKQNYDFLENDCNNCD